MRLEFDTDEETGITIVVIEDVPEAWTYTHEYGRLVLSIPPIRDKEES
jgi:hypothetical protein